MERIAQMGDLAIIRAIGERVRRERLNQDRTQVDVATHAGVGLIVIRRLENGKGCTLTSLVKILRSLRKLEHLDMFLPEPGLSPIQLARLSGRERKEASGRRGRPRKI